MKTISRIFIAILLMVTSYVSNAQGINFQGVSRSANGTILASSNISLRLSIMSKSVDAAPEYIEIKKVVTNAQGIFSIVIGDAVVGSTTGTFSSINWANAPKFLKVEMDPSGGTSYINMGITQLQYVPYSFYSLGVAAENVTGILPVEKGGTGVGSLADLKAALKISNFDSTALSSRIDTKLSKADTISLSNRIDSKMSSSNTSFSSDITVNGSLTANSFKVPGGLSTQYLRADGTVTTSVTAGVPYSGASQATNLGAYDLTVNGITAGLGGGQNILNTAFGLSTLVNNNTGIYNTAIGQYALTSNTSGQANTAVGLNALRTNSTASGNIAIGAATLQNNNGSYNIGIGLNTLQSNTTGTYNLGLGYNTLITNTTGTANIGLGAAALQNNNGSYNIGIGLNSLQSNITGINSFALGYNSLINNTTGSYNIAIGVEALTKNKANSSSLAIGNSAMYYADDRTTGYNTFNTAIGHGALRGTITASQNTGTTNTAVGYESMMLNSSGSRNSSFGDATLGNNSTGNDNIAIGRFSLYNNTVGNYNTGLGSQSLYNNFANNGSVAVGFNAMFYADNRTSGRTTGNTAVGYESLKGSSTPANNTGQYNTALGYQSLTSNTTGSNNTAIGYSAMSSSSTYSNSTALGYNAQVTANNQIQLGDANITEVKTSGKFTAGSVTYPNTAGTNGYYLKTDGSGTASWATVSGSGIPYTGATQAVDLGSYDLTVNGLKIGKGLNNISGNTVLGNNSLSAIGISGGSNTAIGSYNLSSNLTGQVNVSVGTYSLYKNISGSSNVSIGDYALFNNLNASRNVAIGTEALTNNISGDYNTSVGLNSMYYNTIGGSNSALGVSALSSNVNGAYNTAVGVSALASNVSGSNNTAIGNLAMFNNTTYSNSTALGYNAQVTASNQIQLGDANVTDVKTSGVITSSGIRVGTNSPTISAAVEINSNTQGFLPPRMTQTQRDAISTPATGLVIFNSTSNSLEYKSSTSWVSLSVSSPGSAVFLPTIVIGNQQWMKENLDVVTYRNGDVIPQVTDAAAWAGLTTGAWCYYSNSADNGTIYGKLYNWYAVNDSRGLAPQGWHIPTDAEWTTLGNLLGGDAVAGGKMKTTGTTRWNTPNTSATNESGFAGLPGGNRNSDGTYVNISGDGSWWSATPSSSTVARFRQANYNSVLLNSGNAIMVQGYSVRCLRD
jgi:uncharacterized protein (TIGR02145 family)